MKLTETKLRQIIRSVIREETEYQKFFKKELEKTGKSIPQMSDEEKKAFFNKIDKAWKGKGESVDELTKAQEKLPPALKKAIQKKEKKESVNEAKHSFKFKHGIKHLQQKLNKGYSIEGGDEDPQTYYVVDKNRKTVGTFHYDGNTVTLLDIPKGIFRFRERILHVNEAKVIVYNEKTGERYEVLSGKAKGDLLIAMKALQSSAPSHMKYSIKESVNEGKNFKAAKQALIDFNNGKLSEDGMVKKIIKSLGFKFDEYSEEEAGIVIGREIKKGKIPTDDYILKNVIDALTESVNEAKFKKGDKVIVDNPWGTKPVKGVIDFTLKTPKGDVYVLKNGNGVWDEKYIKLAESVNEAKFDASAYKPAPEWKNKMQQRSEFGNLLSPNDVKFLVNSQTKTFTKGNNLIITDGNRWMVFNTSSPVSKTKRLGNAPQSIKDLHSNS